jgi:arylsulfatase A-like enzyme
MHFYPWDISEGFAHRVIAEDKRHYEIQDDYADYLRRHGYAKYHARENPGYRQHLGAAPSRIPLEHQVDLWTADRTVEFLRTYSGDQPFACMVGLPGPHCPYDPPDELADRFDPRTMPDSVPETPESEQLRPQTIEACKREWCDLDYTHFPESARRLIRSYYSSLVHIVDRAVGRILVALEERDDSDSTVVIFASDHGDFLGDYGHIGKRFLFRPSIHIPLLVRLPGGTHEVVPEPVSLTDLFATIVHLAGVHNADTPDAQVLPRVRANADRRREYVFGASPDGYMVIRGPWKLSWYRNGVRSLIHTDRDPDEQTNLYGSGEARPVVQELTEIMNREVYDSLRLANGDKIVDRSIRSAGRTFFERGWERDYPNDPSDG